MMFHGQNGSAPDGARRVPAAEALLVTSWSREAGVWGNEMAFFGASLVGKIVTKGGDLTRRIGVPADLRREQQISCTTHRFTSSSLLLLNLRSLLVHQLCRWLLQRLTSERSRTSLLQHHQPKNMDTNLVGRTCFGPNAH